MHTPNASFGIPQHHPGYSWRRLCLELAIVLAVTFGISGLRSLLRLIDALLETPALNEQTTVLYGNQSQTSWLDIALQLCSVIALCAWGCLAAYLLWASGDWRYQTRRQLLPSARSWLQGAGLAALIGIPGLALYISALHLGLTKQVVPASFDNSWWELPTLLLYSFANAFAEEIVVVAFVSIRLRQLGMGWTGVIASSALLRGSYHLYQGVSAGFGNIVMGIIFTYFYARTGKIWPLILAHFLIDAVAFVGYAAGAHAWSLLQT